MEKAFEISASLRNAREHWQRFAAQHGQGGVEPHFEAVAPERTRVALAGEGPAAERTAEAFLRYVQGAESGLGGAQAAGNPASRGAAPGAAGGTYPGSSGGGTPGPGGGKPGTTPGTT